MRPGETAQSVERWAEGMSIRSSVLAKEVQLTLIFTCQQSRVGAFLMNSTVVGSLHLFFSQFQETYQAANVSTILLMCENALAVQSLVSLMSKSYPSVMAQLKLSNERLSFPNLNGHSMVLPPPPFSILSFVLVYLLCVCVCIYYSPQMKGDGRP